MFVALEGRLALGIVVVKRLSSESFLDFIIYVTGECFVVKPSDSETQRRIGARGSICFLHISRWGISLALQVKHLFFYMVFSREIHYCDPIGQFSIGYALKAV